GLVCGVSPHSFCHQAGTGGEGQRDKGHLDGPMPPRGRGHPLDLPITQCPSGMPGLTDGNLSGEGPEVPRQTLKSQHNNRSSLSPHPVFAAAASGFPPDCSRLRKGSPSGVYVIQPARSPPRVVWCDMDTEGKGWTVVQRNSHDTELTWKQSWTTYKYGFGNVHSDYWLGTEYLHLLTQQGTYKVRFVVRDKANVTHYAEYDIFRVENEASGYPLRLGRHSGDGDDYLTLYHPKKGGIHDNMKFSTVDKDQDQYSGNCAKSYGGWWYNRCQNVLLNAKNYILWGDHSVYSSGWQTWGKVSVLSNIPFNGLFQPGLWL
uniref:Uncharacterized protein n=1 Tax=Geospiza parvula TaxID=87175 RepID=A0A8C3NC23_GEOPR